MCYVLIPGTVFGTVLSMDESQAGAPAAKVTPSTNVSLGTGDLR